VSAVNLAVQLPCINTSSNVCDYTVYKGTGTLSDIWAAIFEYPYVPWFLVICLALSVAMRVNSFEVSKFASLNKERAMESQLQHIEGERRRQEKIIAKLKSIEQEDDLAPGGDEAIAKS
jgi:hypothetical protein